MPSFSGDKITKLLLIPHYITFKSTQTVPISNEKLKQINFIFKLNTLIKYDSTRMSQVQLISLAI